MNNSLTDSQKVATIAEIINAANITEAVKYDMIYDVIMDVQLIKQ